MKRLFLLLIFLASAVCADDYFPVGFWQPPEKVDEAFFKTLADGNFTLVFSNLGNQWRNLDMAKAVGMKGIVYDYPSVLKNLNDGNRKTTLTNLAATHSKHEALWGYYLCDEARLDQFPDLKKAADYLTAKDPDHPIFANLCGTYAPKSWIGEDYDAYLEKYIEEMSPRMIAFDNYPYLTDKDRPDFYGNLESVRTAALKHSIPFWSHVLSSTMTGYKDPDEAMIRCQVYSALAYGARGIMYYTLAPSPGKDRQAILNSDGTATELFEVVKAVNGEIKNLAPTLLKLESKEVYHTRAGLPKGTRPMPYSNIISSVTGGRFIISQFADKDGVMYVMLVNKNVEKKANASVSFAKEVKVAEIDKDDAGKVGNEITVKVGNVLNVTLKAGDGILFVCKQ
ncbi:MAG: hypothetical protein J6X38_01500 [Abditibacteriota bacterium]|nr:hypothetical protein [Abditibacteriota bacterium]